jgi:hypothetical protein
MVPVMREHAFLRAEEVRGPLIFGTKLVAFFRLCTVLAVVPVRQDPPIRALGVVLARTRETPFSEFVRLCLRARE